VNLADPLGPSAHARKYLCRPGERLLWAAYGRVFNYDVNGLTPLGEPKKGALRKFGEGAAGFAGDAVSEMLGGSDDGTDRPAPPEVITFGSNLEALAPGLLRGLPPVFATEFRVWVLTADRFAVLEEVPPESAPDSGDRSFLAKAACFGKGLAKAGKDIADIVTDRTKSYGANREGEPVTPHEMTVRAELPRARIAEVAPARRGSKFRSKPCLRMSLVDGSGFDFLFGLEDPALFEWMLTLTNEAR
jgi:hypothetical protein